ncbi:MAG: class III signal peptide-containing protein [Methanobrevibacter thaueri]|uniref:Class III signal peptide-containing protein n=1 Tax=Methanobrevibacter thaueri TaxID=190975 RepID=A0A8T3VBE3_9EURY|nr:class III signal peptide-containing protein [Methanobrevibacter thaueri]MBE6502249.1 class III signal peptide-containing protein [Methanobrevibacter thaueri]
MNDSKGQVALEYLLIFAVSLILLVIFTLPLTELTIQNTLDVSDTLNAKSDLSKLSQAIEEVYGQGQGSRQTVNVVLSKNCKVNVESNYISCNLKLHDGKSKSEKIYFKSTLEKSALYLKKGENSIVIEWPENSENMQIFVR